MTHDDETKEYIHELQKENEKLQRALEALTLVAKQLESDLIAERKKNETPSN